MLKNNDLKFDSKKEISFIFQENTIVIKPYFTFEDKVSLSVLYIDSIERMFNEGNYSLTLKYHQLEYGLMLAIIEACTNINVSTTDIYSMIESGLWKEIDNHIGEEISKLRKDMEKILEYKLRGIDTELSFGNTAKKVGDYINQFWDIVKSMDIDEIKKISETFISSLKENVK